MTVRIHGFYGSDSVFHSNRVPQRDLGVFRERYYDPDIGLCELSPGNQFNANPPKHLIDTAYASKYIGRTSWFEVDGYTARQLYLRLVTSQATASERKWTILACMEYHSE